MTFLKPRDIHKLIADSAGRCNYLGCPEQMFYEYEDENFVKLIDLCHIIGKSPKGPRGHPTQSQLDTENPENIILLCDKHHKIVDGSKKEYPPERLYKMKLEHVQRVNNLLEGLKEANWTLLLHTGNITGGGLVKIDEELIIREFYGTHIFTEIQKIETPEFLVLTKNWLGYKRKQEVWWRTFQEFNSSIHKIVVCSINFIPLVIHLGYLIHDTATAEVYQFNRQENKWNWSSPEENQKNSDYILETDTEFDSNITNIALSVSISSEIHDNDIIDILGENIKIIKIRVPNPDRTWLRFKDQLIRFQELFIKLLDNLIHQYTALKIIHLFLAGPTPIAFTIGKSINPNMHPHFVLYNYHAKDIPKYSKTFELN